MTFFLYHCIRDELVDESSTYDHIVGTDRIRDAAPFDIMEGAYDFLVQVSSRANSLNLVTFQLYIDHNFHKAWLESNGLLVIETITMEEAAIYEVIKS